MRTTLPHRCNNRPGKYLAAFGLSVGLAMGGWGLACAQQTPYTPPPVSPFSAVPPESKEHMRFRPYNHLGQKELDLWRMETKRFIRSQPVVSPDHQFFAYSEVIYMPDNRQTFSKLYLVPVTPLPEPPPERLPSEPPAPPPPELSTKDYENRFNPDATLQQRIPLLGVGHDRTLGWEFRTLTFIDWSVTGSRLLFKQRSGVLHVGLKTTDILVYDQQRGTVTIYPELQRILNHHWQTHGNLAHIDTVATEIFPLGWEPNSDSAILFKAWAFDKREKKFLGLWRYDIDSQRSELLSTLDTMVPVAANGLIAEPLPEPKTRGKRKR